MEQKEYKKRISPDSETTPLLKKAVDRKEQRRIEAQIRQSVSKERNQLTREIQQLEEKIDFLERRKGEIEFQMTLSETYDDSQFIIQLQKEQSQVQKELKFCFQAWEKAQKNLEKILSQLPSTPKQI